MYRNIARQEDLVTLLPIFYSRQFIAAFTSQGRNWLQTGVDVALRHRVEKFSPIR